MIPDRHFNPVILRKLQQLCGSNYSDEALMSYLKSLSHSNFRVAGYLLGERILTDLDRELFWRVLYDLVRAQSRAFLVTGTRSLLNRLEKGDVSLRDEGFAFFAALLAPNTLDVQKFLSLLIPVLEDVDEVDYVFHSLGLDEAEARVPYLYQGGTDVSYFLLFHALRAVEHDRVLLERIAISLMKKGDTRSFNMASLMKAYFSLEGVKGTFSLSLKPYELSRLEHSFEAFCRMLDF